MAQPQPVFEVTSREISAHNILFTEHAPKNPPFPARLQHVLLLHGWMGTARDLLPLAKNLAEQGYVALAPDLPYHGGSIKAAPGFIAEASHMVFAALKSIIPDRQTPHPIAIVGYSMGGRLAFEMASLTELRGPCSFLVTALVLMSSAPPPAQYDELELSLLASAALERSEALRDLDPTKQAFKRWLLTSWYASPMWGSISKAPGFQEMINARVNAFNETQLNAWCDATICMGPVTMTPATKLSMPTLYICGMNDDKYLWCSFETLWHFWNYECVQVHEAGHNVLLEQRGVVQSSITEFLSWKYQSKGLLGSIPVCSVKLLQYSLPLKREIVVNGEIVSQRDGVIVALLAGDGSVGVGDVSPLPGLHKEDLSTCIMELSHFAAKIQEYPSSVSFLSLFETDSILSDYGPATRCGLEAAYLHLMSRAMKVPLQDFLSRLTTMREPRLERPSSHIFLNGVLPRMSTTDGGADEAENKYNSYVLESNFDTLKLKVGAEDDAKKDGQMAREAAIAAVRLGKRIRLDANRAWTTGKFHSFLSAVENSVSDVEFIEEPLKSTHELATYLESVKDSHTTIPIALDESLENGLTEQVQRMAGSDVCQAFVLKPCLIGSLHRIIDLTTLAVDRDCKRILSTCFESGVGTAWIAVLACVFGSSQSRHGLGTYVYLENDVLEPSFEQFCVDQNGSRVLTRKCEEFLELAGKVVLEKGSEPQFVLQSSTDMVLP